MDKSCLHCNTHKNLSYRIRVEKKKEKDKAKEANRNKRSSVNPADHGTDTNDMVCSDAIALQRETKEYLRDLKAGSTPAVPKSFCINCGHKLSADHAFCPGCGSSIRN